MSTHDGSTDDDDSVDWGLIIVVAIVSAAIVAIIYVMFWAGVAVTRADREKRNTVAEQCETVENEGLRVMCLEDAG